MSEATWIPFDEALYSRQKLPPERRYVLVRVEPVHDGVGAVQAMIVAVGYLRYAAGDRDSPFFVVPSVRGRRVAWCDCLPEALQAIGACWPLPEVTR